MGVCRMRGKVFSKWELAAMNMEDIDHDTPEQVKDVHMRGEMLMSDDGLIDESELVFPASMVGEAFEELGKVVQRDPTANGNRYE